MNNPALEFREVCFHYASKNKANPPTLADLNFRVNDGEFISVIGPSGAGKSTIFRLITGLEQPSSGQILINGEVSINRLGQVGYMPQQDLLMPWRTILENAMLPIEIKGAKGKAGEEMVLSLLKDFGLEGTEDKHPGDLSGGMRQRVSFLRTILSGSNILLLDEPFSALDAITRLTMQEWLLDQWQNLKKTILFITHDVDEALFLSDRIFVMSDNPKALKEVNVPLGRPRSFRDISQPDVLLLKENLIDQLRPRVES
ncbi:ABC transporter ATP-binding protein [Bacillus sp. J33]|uniref:ABC transporter ATP-binding protein n=1 Tax=Bacillus sp. J33 TaxID=935836 RepID=UPI000478B9ED|nr:ABC transporter ATP-binding protein [Bacillus sp. J33]